MPWETLLEKTFHCKRFSIGDRFWVRDMGCVHLPSQPLDPRVKTYAGSVHTATVSGSLYVHQPLASSTSSSAQFPEPRGEGMDGDILPLTECSESLVLCVVWLWALY